MSGFVVGVIEVATRIIGNLREILKRLLDSFWTAVKDWLNNTAANIVEKHLGYNARRQFVKSLCTAERQIDKIIGKDILYIRESPSAQKYKKLTVNHSSKSINYDQQLINYIDEERSIVNTMDYKLDV